MDIDLFTTISLVQAQIKDLLHLHDPPGTNFAVFQLVWGPENETWQRSKYPGNICEDVIKAHGGFTGDTDRQQIKLDENGQHDFFPASASSHVNQEAAARRQLLLTFQSRLEFAPCIPTSQASG